MAINHISLKVTDIEKAKAFYAAALAPVGYKVLADDGNIVGLGTQDTEGQRDVWLRAQDSMWLHKAESTPLKVFCCLAFTAESKEQVEAFYEAALAAGGTDNGAPGYRTQYHPGYYAAFVLDPDGNNTEVVFDDFDVTV